MAKVMLVEDDNNLREIYEARLAAEGYDIVAAQDGEEALALAVKERPDLIIADIMMPKVSGFDMLDILRSTPETKHAKIIMMTALSQAEDKTRAEKLGADRYLVKSQVTLEDVVKVASEMLNEADASSAPVSTPTPSLDQPVVDPVSNVPTVPPDEPTATVPADDATASSDDTTVADTSSPAPLIAPDPSTTAAADEPTTATPVTVTEEPATEPEEEKPVDAAATTLSDTAAEEEAQVSQQIEDFISKNPAQPTPAEPTVTAPETSPETKNPSETTEATFKEEVITSAPPVIAPTTEPKSTSIPVTIAEETLPAATPKVDEPKVSLEVPPAAPAATEGSEADQTLAKAVDSLAGEAKPAEDTSATTESTTADPTTPAEEAGVPQLAKKRGGERVITPLSDPADAGVDLAALLAKEEGDDGIVPPPINAVITPGGTVAHPAPTPSSDTTPPDFTDGTAVPGSVVQPPNPSVTSSEDNPSNIAL
jgi:CheY-like chemotaxis protein